MALKARPNGALRVALPSRGGSTKTVQVLVKEGYFWARFDGRHLRRGTLAASFTGASGYAGVTSRVQVSSSATSKR